MLTGDTLIINQSKLTSDSEKCYKENWNKGRKLNGGESLLDSMSQEKPEKGEIFEQRCKWREEANHVNDVGRALMVEGTANAKPLQAVMRLAGLKNYKAAALIWLE